MNVPADLRYSKDHEWIRFAGEYAYIGITDFAQGELGDIVFVDIPTAGEVLNSEDVFGSVEAVKTVSDLYLPIAGEVVEINADLDGNPEAVNSDPYGAGWMVKIKVTDASEADQLMDAEAYAAFIGA